MKKPKGGISVETANNAKKYLELKNMDSKSELAIQ